MQRIFDSVAQWASRVSGTAVAFSLAASFVIAWAMTGPLFHFSDTWQLVINTVSSIVTFLMVFLIQNTQDRNTIALQIKIDELIRVSQRARPELMGLEDLSHEELERIKRLQHIRPGADNLLSHD